MFNLIMRGAWAFGRETFSGSRLFEYTDKHLIEEFGPKGVPKLAEIQKLPCLFMDEGTDDELAYVGTISNLRHSARGDLEFITNIDIPPLRNADIYDRRSDFHMPEDFEFSRNHWAIKDANLFEAVLKTKQVKRTQPEVFKIGEVEKVDRKLVSVMMPFDARLDSVYAAIRELVTQMGLTMQTR